MIRSKTPSLAKVLKSPLFVSVDLLVERLAEKGVAFNKFNSHSNELYSMLGAIVYERKHYLPKDEEFSPAYMYKGSSSCFSNLMGYNIHWGKEFAFHTIPSHIKSEGQVIPVEFVFHGRTPVKSSYEETLAFLQEKDRGGREYAENCARNPLWLGYPARSRC